MFLTRGLRGNRCILCKGRLYLCIPKRISINHHFPTVYDGLRFSFGIGYPF